MSVLIARSAISLGVCIVFDYSRGKINLLRRNLICLCKQIVNCLCIADGVIAFCLYPMSQMKWILITLWRNRHDFGFRSYFIVRRFAAVLGG